MVKCIKRLTRKRGIKRWQDEYLITHDETCLANMYSELVLLGARIVDASGREHDPDDIYVLASSIIARLIEQQKPVINTAVSAYVKLALFYMHKPPRWLSIEVIAPDDYSYEDSMPLEMIDLTIEVMEHMRGACPDDIYGYVEECIVNMTPRKDIRKIVPENRRKAFDDAMKEVYEYVSKKAVQV